MTSRDVFDFGHIARADDDSISFAEQIAGKLTAKSSGATCDEPNRLVLLSHDRSLVFEAPLEIKRRSQAPSCPCTLYRPKHPSTQARLFSASADVLAYERFSIF